MLRNVYENNLVVIVMSAVEIDGLRQRVSYAEKEVEILKFNADVD